MQRKSTIINEMLLHKGNIVAVTGELSQLDDLFKIIEDTQKEMIALDKWLVAEGLDLQIQQTRILM